jgi:ferredoxin, 2Fe-2S
MPTIHFISADGTRTEVQANSGDSVMHAALGARLKGILGECGGSLACATCHVYVDVSWTDKLAPLSDLESEMLDATACERQPNSRLCCQVGVSDALDGLTVILPQSQL